MSQIAGLIDFRQEGPPADIGTFQFPTSTMVFQHVFAGTTYVCAVRSGARGWVLVDYGTVASTVINNALNALTSGRTWKEKVLLKGDLGSLSAPIIVDSYTILEGIECKLTLANGVNDDVIKGKEGQYVIDVEIRGIYIEGNAGQQTAGRGIDAGASIRWLLEDNRIYNTKSNGIAIGTDATRFGFHNTIKRNYLYNCGTGISSGGYSDENSIVLNVIDGGGITDTGIGLSGGNDYCAGNHMVSCEYYGIYVASARNRVIGNIVDGSYTHGIWVIRQNNIIHGNTIYACGKSAVNTYSGIYLGDASADNNIITENQILDYSTYRMKYAIEEITGCDYNEIALNQFVMLGGQIAVYKVGTNTKVHHNIGFVTENNVLSATFPIAAIGLNTVTIAHGLDITPALKDCQLTVVEETNVDDWGFNLLKVDNVGAVNVVAKIYVSVASATVGATARLALHVGNP